MAEIIVLCGSSRSDGSTKAALDRVLQNVRHEFVDLSALKIEPYEYGGNDRDDYMPLIERVQASQKLILASPVEWYSVSYHVKKFIDRLSDVLAIRKDLVRGLAATQVYQFATAGQIDQETKNSYETPIRLTCRYMNMVYKQAIYFHSKTLEPESELCHQGFVHSLQEA